MSGATNPAHDFIKDQKDIIFIANLMNPLEITKNRWNGTKRRTNDWPCNKGHHFICTKSLN